jgi:hypothetical protein
MPRAPAVADKVKQVIGDDDPTADPGTAAARQKRVKQGDDVSATCKVGGRTDTFIGLIDCTLH